MRHGMKRSLFISTHLENQLVRVDAIRQEEGRAQVPLQLRYFLDKGQQLRINGFLVLLPLLCQLEFLYVKKSQSFLIQKLIFSTVKIQNIYITSFSVSKISPSW